MTLKMLIKKLKKIGVELTEDEKNGFKYVTGRKFEIFIPDANNDADQEKMKTFKDKIGKVLDWNKFRTGFGGMVFDKDYIPNNFYYCDRHNPCHY